MRVRNGCEAGATAVIELGTDIGNKGKAGAKRAGKVLGYCMDLSSFAALRMTAFYPSPFKISANTA
ncbi:hypothetical protein GCM10028822_25240 [Hymenobacter terrigena]